MKRVALEALSRKGKVQFIACCLLELRVKAFNNVLSNKISLLLDELGL